MLHEEPNDLHLEREVDGDEIPPVSDRHVQRRVALLVGELLEVGRGPRVDVALAGLEIESLDGVEESLVRRGGEEVPRRRATRGLARDSPSERESRGREGFSLSRTQRLAVRVPENERGDRRPSPPTSKTTPRRA